MSHFQLYFNTFISGPLRFKLITVGVLQAYNRISLWCMVHIYQYETTTTHNKTQTMCIILGMYCLSRVDCISKLMSQCAWLMAPQPHQTWCMSPEAVSCSWPVIKPDTASCGSGCRSHLQGLMVPPIDIKTYTWHGNVHGYGLCIVLLNYYNYLWMWNIYQYCLRAASPALEQSYIYDCSSGAIIHVWLLQCFWSNPQQYR